MDKFVIRTPTWKTMTYESSRGSLNKSLCNKQSVITKKIPFRENQELGDGDNINKRQSIRDIQLLKIFAKTEPHQSTQSLQLPTKTPAYDIELNSELSCSSSSNSSYHGFQNDFKRLEIAATDENTHPQHKGSSRQQINYLSNISDYVSCPEAQTVKRALPTSQSLPLQQKDTITFPVDEVLYDDVTVYPSGLVCEAVEPQQQPKLPNTPRHLNPLMVRIQRDLNSPSANMRMRAIKAMKSPAKSAYAQFDVPHEEQNLISAEERLTPPPAPTIQELMRDIVVYVEVRTGEDNRSAGVKKVISALGARVNDKLLRDTTHVIFKDGLLSTYKKAKHWGIPIVSILWVEACKTQRKICDPNDYTISNIDRYENPELYEKMKRHKSMQPDSECNKRVRIRPGTPKDGTPKTATSSKKSPTLSVGNASSTPKTANNKKTDIRKFMKQVSSNRKTPKAGSKDSTDMVAESPATQLLNKMNSNSYTPILTVVAKQKRMDLRTDETTVEPSAKITDDQRKPHKHETRDAKKSLNFVSAEISYGSVPDLSTTPTNFTPKSTPQRRTSQRRRSSVQSFSDTNANLIGADMSLSSGAHKKTPHRRSSIHVTANMTLTANDTPTKTSSLRNDFEAIIEEGTASMAKPTPLKKSSPKTPRKRIARRRTTFTAKALDITEVNAEKPPGDKMHDASNNTTTYTPQKMNETQLQANVVTKSISKLTQTSVCAEMMYSDRSESGWETPTTVTSVGNVSSALCSSAIPKNNLTIPPPLNMVNSKVLLEQSPSSTLTFSSTRQPGRRRTFFDVSMDIITQRMQNINKSARRSMAVCPAVSADLSEPHDSDKKDDATNAPNKSATTPNLCLHVPRSKTFFEDDNDDKTDVDEGHAEQNSTGDSVPTETNLTPTIAVHPPKKRKLFMPNDSLLHLTQNTIPSTSSGSMPMPTISKAKRRRTLLPNSHPVSILKSSTTTPTSKATAAPVPTPTPTRVTKKQAAVSMPSTAKKPDEMEKLTPSNTARTRRLSTFNAATTVNKPRALQATVLAIADNANGIAGVAQAETSAILPGSSAINGTKNNDVHLKRRAKCLVYTNMHKEQVDVIREALLRLGGFMLESAVTGTSTHVVSLEPRRTLNLLRALARGLWILEYSWITDSLRAGRWLAEEPYELRDFSRAVEICRAERQAFGNTYKCELFSDLGPFYISTRCGPVSKENLKELINLCGGRIVEQRKRAKYILGHANKALEDKVYITPFWILDSITQMQLLKFYKYTSSAVDAASGAKHSTQPTMEQVATQHATSPQSQVELEVVPA